MTESNLHAHQLKSLRIQQFGAAAKKKEHLHPDAQRLLVELSTVNDIKNKVDFANAFVFRSFRLRLEMEVAA